MTVIEILVSAAMVVNKVAVFGIALGAIWVLQHLMNDERWRNAFPILDSYLLRGALTLVAAGFGIDFFSVYTPSVSEVVMNIGIAVLLLVFHRQFKRRNGDHPLLRWKNKKISNQKNNC